MSRNEDRDELPVNIIKPTPGLGYWKEAWSRRELLYMLAWRDFLVRYKQTVLGMAWSVFRPLLTALSFTFIFGVLAKLPSEGQPYALLVLAGLMPWQVFAQVSNEMSRSLLDNRVLLGKVYFPRILLPLACIFTAMIDFAIAMLIFLAMCIYFGMPPSGNIVYLPFFVLLVVMLATGLGLLSAALNVQYRDVTYIFPFIMQLLFYISPVGFSSRIIPPHLEIIYIANPLVGIINGTRWCLLGGDFAPYQVSILFSCISSCLLLALALWMFKKMEFLYADVI